ncbi:MAG: VCBS repeat-containing protein [Verrucomicrobiota bacterium]
MQATVTAASETNLTVTVPVGATYAPITETVDGLTAWADAPFVVTFSSGGTLDLSSLAPRVDLDAGSGPFAVAIGDLVSTNGALTTGSFAPAVVLLVGGGRDSLMGLALADLDGDGRLDIVVANYNHNNVSVFQNLCVPGSITTNSFGVRVDLPVGVQPVSVAARDLDGDGRPEIITANIGDSTVSVLQNLGAGGGIITTNSFAPAVNFVAATGPSCVVVADLDGDGKPDLATANHSDSSSIARVRRWP